MRRSRASTLAKILRDSGCKRSGRGRRRLRRGEPRIPRRHRDPADRRRRRRRLPARRRMPLRPGRGAAGAQLRAARRRHRAALFVRSARRRLQPGQRPRGDDRGLPVRRPAVSAPPMAERTPSWFRWVRDNVAVGLARLVRPARGRAEADLAGLRARGDRGGGRDRGAHRSSWSSSTWLRSRRRGRRRRGSRQSFQFATDFGLSGWFLFPLGGALLAIALVTSPALTRMSQLVLASLAVRLGFLFLAIAVPGLVVTIVKRIVGRARPLIAGEDAFLYKFFLWRVEYASFPSGHATTAFAAAIAFGVLWPRLRPLLWTYAIVIALEPGHRHRASSERCGGRRHRRRGRRAAGAGLVWRRAGSAFRSVPTARSGHLPGPSWARIKRVARSLAGQ